MEEWKNTSHLGDCMDIMLRIPDASVDMILADLPYQVTKNSWDSMIPLDKLWEQYNRIIKDNGAIVLFGQDKFSAKLMLSNEKMHRYNLIWKKGERTSGFLNAKKMPLRNHEDILVFYKSLPTYNPQMVVGKKAHSRGKGNLNQNNNYGDMVGSIGDTPNGDLKYPKSILNFDRPHPPVHPTQKSTELCEWLINTYTNEGEIVLDNCAGSFTTALASINTNRKYICIEQEEKYYQLGIERIDNLNETRK
jgi:site-specific DNA-methyltransferase (adenine-specific)